MSESAKSQKPSEQKEAPHYLGHRERLRKRFLEGGNAAITDYEMLELVLFRALPRRDVKPLAKALLKTFGSFAEVLAAPAQRLGEISGLGEAAITDLKIVHAAAMRLARDEIRERQVLSSWSHVLDYCRAAMAFADKEQFRILFLDKRNHLIADEMQQTGNRGPHPCLSARGGQACARAFRHGGYPRAQSSERRSDPLTRRYYDDAGNRRGGAPARHRGARPHHCRQGRPRESQGAEADVSHACGGLLPAPRSALLSRGDQNHGREPPDREAAKPENGFCCSLTGRACRGAIRPSCRLVCFFGCCVTAVCTSSGSGWTTACVGSASDGLGGIHGELASRTTVLGGGRYPATP